MENNSQKLAERIADFLRRGESEETNDFAALQESVERINERLFKIENSLIQQNAPPANGDSQAFIHPSREKFEIAEAVSHGAHAEQSDAEKPCPFEPTGKACDHCSMCSSLGF